MLYFVIVLNCVLSGLIPGFIYSNIGIVMFVFCILMVLLVCNTKLGAFFIRMQTRSWGKNVDPDVFKEKRLLMSLACLSFALKVGALFAFGVETGAALLIAICILGGAGWFFEGSSSGMSPGLAYGIAKIAVKLYSWFSIGFDKLVELIAKFELSCFNIEY